MVFGLPPAQVNTSPYWPTRKPQERRRPGRARTAQGGAPPPAPLVISSLLLWRTDSDGVPSPFKAVPSGVPSRTQTVLTGASPLPMPEVLEPVEPNDAPGGGRGPRGGSREKRSRRGRKFRWRSVAAHSRGHWCNAESRSPVVTETNSGGDRYQAATETSSGGAWCRVYRANAKDRSTEN